MNRCTKQDQETYKKEKKMYKNGERTVQKRIKEGLKAAAQSFPVLWGNGCHANARRPVGKAGGRKNDDFRRNGLSSKEQGVMGKTVWLKKAQNRGDLGTSVQKGVDEKSPCFAGFTEGKRREVLYKTVAKNRRNQKVPYKKER